MARTRPFRVLAGPAAALLLIGGGATAAFADQLVIDGDGLAPVLGPDGQAAEVAACTDQPVTFTVLIAARRNGGDNVTFANGSTVTVSVDSADASMTVALPEDPTITVLSNWQTRTNGTLSTDYIAASITLPAQTAAGGGAVTFRATGPRVSDGQNHTQTKDVSVSWGAPQKCILDSTPPVVTVPSGVTAEATGSAGAVVTFVASATDETAPAAPEVSCTPASGSVFALGDTKVDCSATDAANHTATASFFVHVVDTTAPVVGPVTDIGIEATGAGTLVTWDAPAVFDAVSDGLSADCLPASGAIFPVGTTTVTCAATDAAHNTGSTSFTVTVSDTTAPSIVVPGDIQREADGPLGTQVAFTATALDLVDGALPVHCVPASGTVFAVGVTSVECSAADAAGTIAVGRFEIRIVDTTPPVVTVPALDPIEATGPGGAPASFTSTAFDTVDGALPVTCDAASGDTFALGATTVTCTAEDAAGNVGEASFVISVVDTTAPVFAPQADLEVEATGPLGAPASYEPTATDLVDAQVEVVCDSVSGSTFALGETAVSCSAADHAGNTAVLAFVVRVVDTKPPTITWVGGPVDGATYVYGSVPPAGSCTAVDLVDGAVACAVGDSGPATGAHTLTATAVDAHGNAAAAQRHYTIAAWTLGGFFQPVDVNGTWNSVKGGATVPLKFEAFAGSTELTSVTAVQGFTVKGVACPGSGTATDDIELTTTGGTSLRYDATAGQFIQNWQTPKSPGSCYKVTMTTLDGSSISALFKLK
ncbi:HYR domain-containing protein [Microbacterium sp. NEAU-LLC]|uniref:HYR domain-containing protein n=1 Tax=Microbacterium helvum TaxID=2773713 RepID=A0ABR8NPA0_9MICO|nr:HYR domain-containing protein [Microbacterium helvum]MBD3942469.1 HYR domain-containing protein [Microbacterium helvum]